MRPIIEIATRLDVSITLEPVLALAYGRYLLGSDGLAPVDVVGLLGAGQWDEALGRGELVARGAMTFEHGRLRLAAAVMRALDDEAPRAGALVGSPGVVSLLGPCAIVASGPLPIIAEACLSSIGGAILAAHDAADPSELMLEARPYGAAPMWRVRIDELERIPADRPIILVVEDDAAAEQLGVPRLT